MNSVTAHSVSGGLSTKSRPPKKLPGVNKRAHSASPLSRPPSGKGGRRCASLSPTGFAKPPPGGFGPFPPVHQTVDQDLTADTVESENGTEHQIPQCMMVKIQRALATKKREFIKLRKNLIQLQKQLLEMYASIREMESRAGAGAHAHAEQIGDVRVLSVTTWPAHDLLLLVREDLELPMNPELSGVFGPQVLQQLHAQLSSVPEEVVALCAELMARRIDILNLMRARHRSERAFNTATQNLEWKTKNSELDQDTERLHRLVAGAAENLKAKINYSLELAKIPWLDRDALAKKAERLQRENSILQHRMEEKTFNCTPKEEAPPQDSAELDAQALKEELMKERAARAALKEVVGAAESMLRVARTRITSLERQLKDSRGELEATLRKHRELEQLHRHRETSYDARSKKLLEVSKNGEMTIDALSRQRDALELRVKELREQMEAIEKNAETREAEQRAKTESLQAKVLEQEKKKEESDSRIAELENKIKELEDVIQNLRERSGKLVDMERRRCLDYLPSKESEPSNRETEIWKELQLTRMSLSRAEEELRSSRADKENFLYSLSKIAQEGAENIQEKMATELLEREQKILKLQQIIEEQRENEKLMEQSMTQYENQLANLRLEVKRLSNYDCYSKEVPYQTLQTELMELQMRVDALTHERTALVTAAASRALMLERHERAADLFARVTRARRELSALLEGRTEPPLMNEIASAEVSRSLSSICLTSAETWTALRAERARVLRLESAVLAQSLQLEREGRVRTQLERRRALLERQVLRAQASTHEPVRNTTIAQACHYRRHALL